jgi:hypothetical protein
MIMLTFRAIVVVVMVSAFFGFCLGIYLSVNGVQA